MIGVHGVSQPEHISKHGGAQECRPVGERDHRPGPGDAVDGKEQ